ncbi:DUF4038 domain-containing protein [Polaribacter sp. Z014]|uniref:apiosidase-like domain-containing protein n=1 Tax=Polaribacter sp. Z014 TaxID=2927126 RepID=UPI0032E41FA5
MIRFSSSLKGYWSFKTFGGSKKLADKKGKVTILENKKDNHGAIVIHKENPKLFYYEDGTPYFLLAFECDWLYALDYHNENKLPKTNHLLNLIDKNGFNQIVMNVFSYDVSWKKDKNIKEHPEHEFGGPTDIFPFLGNNDNPDFSSLNPEFFKKLDRTISLLHDKRIVSHLMIYVWNKLVAWPNMNSDADNMYFDYVIKRYQAFPNIVWDISKEALLYGRADEPYIKNRIIRARKNETYNRLLSVHDYKYCSKKPEDVDFISTQNWSHNIYNKMLDDYTKFNDKPGFNIEHGGYEASPYKVFSGSYTNAEVCLRRNYLCLFARTYTTYYWQGTSWNLIIYNPYKQPDDFIKPKFEYFKYMQDLFKQFDYSKMKPTPLKNSAGYNLTNDEGTILLYFPKENVAINAWFLNPDRGERTIQWFNTLTGKYTYIKTIKKGQKYISPWTEKADAILISKLKK